MVLVIGKLYLGTYISAVRTIVNEDVVVTEQYFLYKNMEFQQSA